MVLVLVLLLLLLLLLLLFLLLWWFPWNLIYVGYTAMTIPSRVCPCLISSQVSLTPCLGRLDLWHLSCLDLRFSRSEQHMHFLLLYFYGAAMLKGFAGHPWLRCPAAMVAKPSKAIRMVKTKTSLHQKVGSTDKGRCFAPVSTGPVVEPKHLCLRPKTSHQRGHLVKITDVRLKNWNQGELSLGILSSSPWLSVAKPRPDSPRTGCPESSPPPRCSRSRWWRRPRAPSPPGEGFDRWECVMVKVCKCVSAVCAHIKINEWENYK